MRTVQRKNSRFGKLVGQSKVIGIHAGLRADVMKLVDMRVLEARGVTRVGSSPTVRTNENAWRDAKMLHEIQRCVKGSASFAEIYQDCLELDALAEDTTVGDKKTSLSDEAAW